MSKKMGRPLSDKPKSTQISVRFDSEGIELLTECCKETNMPKSHVLREGLELFADKFIRK